MDRFRIVWKPPEAHRIFRYRFPVAAKDESEGLALWRANAFDDAASWVLHAYGPEIAGYLLAFEKDADTAEDIFAECCTAIWQGLPRFRGECTLRTYVYAVARRQWASAQRARQRRREDRLDDRRAQVADHLRTTTAEYLKTENKERLAQLRDALADDERALLTLRLDRKLDWLAIARVIDHTTAPTEDTLMRSAATLRKRFERLKERFRRELRGDQVR